MHKNSKYDFLAYLRNEKNKKQTNKTKTKKPSGDSLQVFRALRPAKHSASANVIGAGQLHQWPETVIMMIPPCSPISTLCKALPFFVNIPERQQETATLKVYWADR